MGVIRKVVLFFSLLSILTAIAQCPSFIVENGNLSGLSSTILKANSGTSSTPFNWYRSESGGQKIFTGGEYTTPMLSCDATYYVEDTSMVLSTNLVAGYAHGSTPLSGNGSKESWGYDHQTTYFDSDYDLVINSVTIRYSKRSWSCNTGAIKIHLRTAEGVVSTHNVQSICGSGTDLDVVPVNFTVPKGKGHKLYLSGAQELVFFYNSGADFDVDGDLDYTEGIHLTGTDAGETGYGAFFDWDVTIQNYCPRLAVSAIQTVKIDEICDNGIDDNCDGLIDYFDPTCNADAIDDGFYFGNPIPACQIIPNVDPNFGLEEVWRSDKAVETRGTPAVGDIDGDGVPEVIAYNTGSTRKHLYVFSGLDGTTEVEMSPEINAYSQSASIADTDGDGLGEVYIVDEFRNLLCFENDGTPKAGFSGSKVGRGKSGTNAPDNSYHPAFADFDGDGVPEIYIANQVFNSLTGVLMAEPNDPDNSSKGGAGTPFPAHAYPAAWDILPDDFCSDCSGTELICGNTVYSVNITSGTLTAVSTAPGAPGAVAGLPDGKVALADWDGDGLMDIVISAACCGWGGSIYIWDPRKQELITQDAAGSPLVGNPVDAQSSANTNTGNPSIADFDGDGLLEIAYAANDEYVVLDNDLSVKWTRVAVDESNQTTSTAFDFEGDGKTEVVYRDENVLYILNGETGAVKAQTPCGSGTRTEQPIVVDVDGDGDAEIVCNCADNDQGGQGQVRVYHSNTNEWVNTRRVWHQHNYTPVYVNDDLTIPRNFQNKALLAKQDLFFAQTPIVDVDGDPIFTGLPDIKSSIDSVVFNDCGDTDGTAYVEVCNEDLVALVYDFDLSYYEGDPKSGGTLLNTIAVKDANWNATNNRCIQVPITIPNRNYLLHVYVNDDGTDPVNAPVKTFDECDLTNNSSSIPVNCNKTCILPSKNPVLNPDSVVSVCDVINESITSSGEDGYYFSWYKDGTAITSPTLNDSIYNVQSVGKYTVRVAESPSEINNSSCYLQSDTTEFVLNQSPNFTLGNDTIICKGDSIIFGAQIAGASYSWNTGDVVSGVVVDTIGEYILSIDVSGCVAKDTIELMIEELPIVNLGNDTSLCSGNSLLLDAENIGLSYLWSTGGVSQTIDVNSSDDYAVKVTSANGCESVDSVSIVFNPVPVVDLGSDTSICFGDSLLLDAENTGFSYVWNTLETNQMITVDTSGIYVVEVSGGGVGCSDADTIEVAFNSLLVVDLGNDTSLCQGNSLLVDAGNTGSNYLWSSGEITQMVSVSSTDTLSVIVTDGVGCEGKDKIVVTVNPVPVVELGNDTTLCFGDTLSLSADNLGFSYSWNTTETSQQIKVDTSGVYVVEVLGGGVGCSDADTIEVVFNSLPVVDLGNDTSLCQGNSLLVDAGNVGSNYLWSTGISSQTVSVSSTDTLSVIVTDGVGCEGKDTIVVTVNPVPIVSLGNDTTVCFGDTLELDAENSGFSYSWNTTETTQSIQADTSGVYIVEVSGGGVGCSDADTIEVIFNALPVVNLGNDTTVCDGEVLSLDGTNLGRSYLWNTGMTSQTIEVSKEDIYWVKVTDLITKCIGVDSLALTISKTLIPTISNLPTDVCLGSDNITLTLSPTGGVLSGVGLVGNVFNPNDGLVIAEQVNWIKYELTNIDGCVNTDSSKITVHNIPKVEQIVKSVKLCVGDKTELSINSTDATLIEWYEISSSTLLEDMNTYSVEKSGDYFVKVSNTWCSSNSDTVSATFLSPNVQVEADKVSLIEGESTRLFVANPNSELSYSWTSLPAGLIEGNLKDVQVNITPKATATYLVKASFSAVPTCFVQDDIVINVVGQVLPDQVFSPGNGDGVNDYWRIVSLNASSYPYNDVKVYNRWGTLVYEAIGYNYDGSEEPGTNAIVWDGTFNGKLLPVGAYYYVIELKDESQSVLSGSISIVR